MCGCLLHAPYQGPGQQPRHVPWVEIEPATLCFTVWCSIHWATPARADSWASLRHLCHTFICAALIDSSLKAFRIIPIVSAEKCSSLMQNFIQIHCYTCSITLNVTATQYTSSLNGLYCLHWLVQCSRHCSCILIEVHSPWLPGYIDVVQTVLIIFTMAGLFPDTTCNKKYVFGLPSHI